MPQSYVVFHVDSFSLCISAGEIAAWMCTHCVLPHAFFTFITSFRFVYERMFVCVYVYVPILVFVYTNVWVLFAVSDSLHTHFLFELHPCLDAAPRLQFGLFDSRCRHAYRFWIVWVAVCVFSLLYDQFCFSRRWSESHRSRKNNRKISKTAR